ncbi:MAG: ArnT family glycosyltransferase [Phycisphaerae bacterium]
MTSPSRAVPARGFQIRHPVPLLLLLAAVLIYSFRAYNLAVPSFYGIADEHGYMMTAKRLATHGAFAQHQPDPYAFIGETMMQSAKDPTVYYLRQPVGYPLLLAAAYWLGGPGGPYFVNPLLGIALLIAVYIIGRELGAPLMGAVAAIVLACHPLVLYYTVTPLSHVPDMADAAWTIALALLWRKHPHAGLAAGIGAFLGLAIMIRYTNVLLALPLAVILLDKMKALPRRQLARHAALAGLLTFLFMIPLLIYHTVAYGSPFRTGYSAGGNATSFSLAWLVQHAPVMAGILFSPGTGLGILLLGLAAGLILLSLRNRFALALLLAWALPSLLLYTAYYGMPQNNILLYARFALASFPPLILLAVLWPAALPKKRPLLTGIAAAIAAISIPFALFSPYISAQLAELNNTMLGEYTIGNLVRAEVPPGSVLLADLFTQYYLDYVGDYTVYTRDMYANKILAKRLADLQHTPHENDPARTQQMADLLGGKDDQQLTRILRDRLARYDAAGTPVYLLTANTRGEAWSQILGARLHPLRASEGGDFVVYHVIFPPATASAPAASRP